MDLKVALFNILQKIKFGTFANPSPANGEVWFDGTDICVRSNSSTRKLTISNTAHGVLIGNGYGDITASSAGTAGQVLVSGGASADPAFSSSWIGKTWTKRKTADQDIASSTTLQNDSDIVFPIGANEKCAGFSIGQWVVGAGNLKIDFTIPSGCTGTMSGVIAGAGFASVSVTTGKSIAVTLTASSDFKLVFDFQNGSNAGNIQYRFTQNTSNGANTTHKKDSIFQLTRYE